MSDRSIALDPPPALGVATDRGLLRHTVATLAYRAAKAVRDVPPGFGDYALGHGTRSPVEILAHMGDLFDWALTTAQGQTVWRATTPGPWADECDRFFAALATFDDYLASSAEISSEVLAELFQGPIADALTHTGQLSLLRRCADAPVRPENYARAEIVAGRSGREQAAPRREFD